MAHGPHDPETERIGKLIADARRNKGLSIDEVSVDAKRALAMHIGLSRNVLQRIEQGYGPAKNIDPLVLEAICRQVGLDLVDVSVWHAQRVEKIKGFLLRSHSDRKRTFVATAA